MNIKTNQGEKLELAVTALYDVLDPEIGLNIIDLGLVYEIDFNGESGDIVVTMTLTTQFCPMGDSIVSAATQAMQQAFPEGKVQVNLIFDPPWDTTMISEEGNKFLNF